MSQAQELLDGLTERAVALRDEALDAGLDPLHANRSQAPEIFNKGVRLAYIALQISRHLEVASGMKDLEDFLSDK